MVSVVKLETKKIISIVIVAAIAVGIGAFLINTSYIGGSDTAGNFQIEKGDYMHFDITGVSVAFGVLDGTMRWEIVEETGEEVTVQTKYTGGIANMLGKNENSFYEGTNKSENIYIVKEVSPKENLWSGGDGDSVINIRKTRENGTLVSKETIKTELGEILVSHYERNDNLSKVDVYYEENVKIPIKVSADIGNMASMTLVLNDTNIEEILDKFE